MNEEVIITIDTDGNATVEVKNGDGVSCKALTEDIEKALGTVVSDQLTADYHKQPRLLTHNRSKQ